MQAEKSALRRNMARWTLEQSGDALRRSDEAIFQRFLALPELAQARTVLLFWGMRSEPDTSTLVPRLLRLGKVVGLPCCTPGGGMEFRKFLGSEWMMRHPLGMLEPDLSCPLLDPAAAELAVVPAVCYDARGYRLGRGGGFYDRFLSEYTGFSVGFCRKAQLQERVPVETHDRAVRLVITEDGTVPENCIR